MFYIKNENGEFLTNTAGYNADSPNFKFTKKPGFGTIRLSDKAFAVKFCRKNKIKKYVFSDTSNEPMIKKSVQRFTNTENKSSVNHA